MNRTIVFPVPWYIPLSIVDFALITMLIPASFTYVLLNFPLALLQRHQEDLRTPFYAALVLASVVSVVGCVQLIRKALSIRKDGLDYSYAAKAPRTLRCYAWLMLISFSALLVFYCVILRSPLLWLCSIYLLASMLGLAVTADFAARAAMAADIAAKQECN